MLGLPPRPAMSGRCFVPQHDKEPTEITESTALELRDSEQMAWAHCDRNELANVVMEVSLRSVGKRRRPPQSKVGASCVQAFTYRLKLVGIHHDVDAMHPAAENFEADCVDDLSAERRHQARPTVDHAGCNRQPR